jgi:hypothetical protein
MKESANRLRASLPARDDDPHGRWVTSLLRSAKFALAAVLAGSRIVPLGDNGRITRELGAYGARLHHDV